MKTTMLTAIVIEDEESALLLLSTILKDYCPSINYIGNASTIKTSVELIEETKPDIIFLDINLKDGLSFEIWETLDYNDFSIIFTTAYDQYALKAFKLGAIDYLLKPYSPSDVIKSVEKAKKFIYSESIPDIHSLIDRLTEKESKKISFSTSDGIHLVKVDSIIRCQADGSYSIVHIEGNKKLMLSKPLREITSKIDSTKFFRVHASHLVNMDQVTKYSKEDGGFIIMSDESQIPVSRRKKQEFMERIRK